MLRVLREHATSWMLRGILVLVAVTFISWGGYSLIREKKPTYAAMVNGDAIGMREYIDAYQNMIKQYRDALGSSFSDKMMQDLHLQDRILDDLISRALILQEGRKLGISVGDEELRAMIESVPAFQVNGQFDPRIYERFLRLNRMTIEDFERTERERLLLSKVVNVIRLNGGKVSEEEVLDTYRFENDKIGLSLIKIVPASFKGESNANEVDVKSYYESHKEDFRIPAFIQVQYLLFRASDYGGKVQVSSDEIQRYYDLQKERFKTPPQVKAREILVKLGPQDPPEKVEEKGKKAEDILEKAKKTKDFGSLAKQYSESGTASKGGEMGWLQRGTLDEQTETALFSLKAGEVSTVLRRPSGFSIFKVEEVREERQRSLEEAREEILQGLKKEKAKAEASRQADDAFYSIFRSRDLEKFSQEKGVPIKTTPFFKEGDEVPEIGRDPAFYSNAFSLKVGEISPVVGLPPNFYILKLIGKKDSRIPPLEEVKEEVKRKVIDIKCEEKARQVAEETLNQIRKGKTIREIAKERNLPVEETGLFTRTAGVIPKIGPVRDSMGMLSSLTEKNPVPKESLRTNDGFFVVTLQTSESPDMSKFQSVKKDLERRLIYQKQDEFLQNWLSQLRTKAKIEINQEAKKVS